MATNFATTQWSVVLAAGRTESPEAIDALETLCRTYWYPVYAFVRRSGHGPDDAQDLTQEFFAQLLHHHRLKAADPARGRFRGFLVASLRNFLANEWDKARAVKRGGGQTAVAYDDSLAHERFIADARAEDSPGVLFERTWAMTLLTTVRDRLRQEFDLEGKHDRFEWLQGFLPGEPSEFSSTELSKRMGLSAVAVRSEVHRFRERFRTLVRHEIAHTVVEPGEIDDEIRHLIAVLTR